MRGIVLVSLVSQMLSFVLWTHNAQAAFQTFTTLSSFTTATTSLVPTLISFDAVGSPTTIANGSSFQNVTFAHAQNFFGSNLVITDGLNTGTTIGPAQLPTVSGTQFLGNSVNANLTAGRHNITLQFNPASQIAGVGMFIVVPGTGRGTGILDVGISGGNEIRLSANNGNNFVQLGAVQQTLRAGQADEAQVYFMGLYNDSGLLGDILLSTPGITLAAYQYRLDDLRLVAVPEPSSLAALGIAGAIAGVRQLRKRKNKTA